MTGDAKAGSTVTIYDGTSTTALGSTIADTNGHWSFTPDLTSQADATHSFTAKVSSTAGVLSSASYTVTIDTKAPNAPSIISIADDVGSVKDPVNRGGVTDDTTPTLSGTAEKNSTVNIYDNGTWIGKTTADDSGNWSYTATPPLSGTKHIFTATATDAAGNTGVKSDPYGMTLDVTPPTVTVVAVGDGNKTAAEATATGGVLTVNSEAGSTSVVTFVGQSGTVIKTITNTGVAIPVVLTAADLVTLGNGAVEATTVTSDAAGNTTTTPDGSDGDFILDTIKPATPSITSLVDDIGNKTGLISAANGNLTTDDSNPTVNGLAEPGSTVNVYDNGKLIGSTTASSTAVAATATTPAIPAGSWSFTPDKPLNLGSHTITAEAVDAAGNVSDKATSETFTTISADAPAAPAITGVINDNDLAHPVSIGKDGVTNDKTPFITGTGAVGDTITVYDTTVVNGVSTTTVIGTATVLSDKSWSINSSTLLEGAHTITASATNAAHNTSPSTGPYPIRVDLTPPDVATGVVLTDNVGAVLGEITNTKNNPTDDNTPTVSGKGEPGATVSIKDKGVEIGTAIVDENGNWSFTPTKTLDNGAHSITTTQTDPAGNTGKASAAIDFTVDNSQVLQPTITSVIDNVNNVDSAGNVGTTPVGISSGGVTNDATPTLTGDAKAGSTVTIYDGTSTTALGSTIADTNGHWSFTPDLTSQADATHSFTAKVSSTAGVLSSASYTVTIDTKAPNAPSIISIADDVGSVKDPVNRGGVTDDTTPTLSGTAEKNSTVNIYDNGTWIGKTTADDSGNWSYTATPPLSGTKHIFTATATDAAGNTGVKSDPYGMTLDVTPPTVTVVAVGDGNKTAAEATATGGVLTVNSEAGSTSVVTFVGQSGTVIKTITNTGVAIPVVLTAADLVTLGNGAVEATTVTSDAAGNTTTTPDGSDGDFILDTIKPATPSITSLVDDIGNKTGLISAANGNLTTDDSNPTVNGLAEPGSTVNVYDNGKLIGSTTASSTAVAATATTPAIPAGSWSFTPDKPLNLGSHTITAEAVDAAGNVSDKATSETFTTISADAPAAPAITGVINDNDLAHPVSIGKDGVTNDKTPFITGTGAVGDTITVYDTTVVNGVSTTTVIGTATVLSDKSWSINSSTLLEGAHTITASATNAAHNTSPSTGPYPIRVDLTPPDVATGVVLTDNVGAVLGEITNTKNNPTDDNTPTVSGKGEPGATVSIKDKGVEIGTAIVDENGNWSFTPTKTLDNGAHSITTTQTDPAGNTGKASAAIDFTVDNSQVLQPTITSVIDNVNNVDSAGNVGTTPVGISSGGVTNDATPTLTGDAKAGSTVTIYDGTSTTALGSTIADTNGHWSFTPDLTSQADATHSFTAKVSSTAGVLSSASYTVTIDTKAPNAPSIISIADDVGSVKDPVNRGGVTDDTTPTLSGTAEKNSTVNIYDNGTWIGKTTADDSGNWSYTATPPLSGTKHIFTATATDAAGNTGVKSDPYGMTLDVTPPTVTVVAVGDGNKTAAEATATGGVLTVNSEAGSTSVVTFVGQSGTVIKTITNTGVAIPVVLTAADLVTLGNGAVEATTVTSDAAGNTTTTPDGSDGDFILDTIAPTVAVAITAITDDTGSRATDFITNDTTLVVSGTLGAALGAGENVQISTDNGATWKNATVNSTASGTTWTYSDEANPHTGNVIYQARVVDAAGNVGSTASQLVMIDTSAPVPTSGATVTVGENVATTTTVYTVTSTDASAASGTSTTYSLSGADASQFNVDADGKVTFKASPNFEAPTDAGGNNVYNINVVATDAAGNAGSKAVAITVTNTNDAPVVSATHVNQATGLLPATPTQLTIGSGINPELGKTPAGWTTVGSVGSARGDNPTDLPYADSTSAGVLWTVTELQGTSQDGNNVVAIGSWGGGNYFGGMTTAVSGLTIGQSYSFAVEWQQVSANITGGSYGYFAGGQLVMSTGNASQTAAGTNAQVYTSSGLGDSWQTAVYTFTATSTTENINVLCSSKNGVGLWHNSMLVVDSLTATQYSVGESKLSAGATVFSVFDPTGSISTVGVNGTASGATGYTTGIVSDEDAAAALKGWAITSAAASGANHWEYSTNGGTTWVSLAGASTSAAILLHNTDLIRWNGIGAAHTPLSAVAVDETNTSSYFSTVDVSNRGGSTAFSANQVTFGELAPATSGNDVITGSSAVDAISGGAGNDTIRGGGGNDTMTGGNSGADDNTSDVFVWLLADKGAIGVPAIDTINYFNTAAASAGGDVLNLKDLLVGENHASGAGNLANYLHFEHNGVNTIVHISSAGGYAGGFDATKDVQQIVLTNDNLVTGFANDAAIIQDLLSKQKLIVD